MHAQKRLSDRNTGMMLGAALTLAGVGVGAALFGAAEPEARAQALGGPHASLSLPAITLAPNEVALAADRDGRYLVIDTRGNVAPLRIKDTELRLSPGESFVRAP